MAQLRLFVSVDLPAEIRTVVADLQRFVRKQRVIRGVYADAVQAHITIAFIGSVGDAQYDAIVEALEAVEPITCEATVGPLGTFDRWGDPSVLFLSLDCPPLIPFATQIGEALAPWFEMGDRPFVPHVTLARIKGVSDIDRLQASLEAAPVPEMSFTLSGFSLKKSELTPDGPVHTLMKQF